MKGVTWIGFFLLLVVFSLGCSVTTGAKALATEPATSLATVQVIQIQATSELPTPAYATSVTGIDEASTATFIIDPSASSSPTESPEQATIAITPPLVTSGVAIERDHASYQEGDPLFITIHNNLDLSITTQDDDNCSGIALEKQVAGRWSTLDSCVALDLGAHAGSSSALIVGPKSKVTNALVQDGQGQGSQDLLLGEPVAPAVFEGDLRTLPTITPPKPGEPPVEVPRGGSGKTTPASDSSPNASEIRTNSVLRPGIYRITLTFVIGSELDLPYTVYSDEFIIFE